MHKALLWKIMCPAMKQWRLYGLNIVSPALNELSIFSSLNIFDFVFIIWPGTTVMEAQSIQTQKKASVQLALTVRLEATYRFHVQRGPCRTRCATWTWRTAILARLATTAGQIALFSVSLNWSYLFFSFMHFTSRRFSGMHSMLGDLLC